jgi:hypothetical protein
MRCYATHASVATTILAQPCVSQAEAFVACRTDLCRLPLQSTARAGQSERQVHPRRLWLRAHAHIHLVGRVPMEGEHEATPRIERRPAGETSEAAAVDEVVL